MANLPETNPATLAALIAWLTRDRSFTEWLFGDDLTPETFEQEAALLLIGHSQETRTKVSKRYARDINWVRKFLREDYIEYRNHCAEKDPCPTCGAALAPIWNRDTAEFEEGCVFCLGTDTVEEN
mgnify:CR=1 FL=1